MTKQMLSAILRDIDLFVTEKEHCHLTTVSCLCDVCISISHSNHTMFI